MSRVIPWRDRLAARVVGVGIWLATPRPRHPARHMDFFVTGVRALAILNAHVRSAQKAGRPTTRRPRSRG